MVTYAYALPFQRFVTYREDFREDLENERKKATSVKNEKICSDNKNDDIFGTKQHNKSQ